MKKASIVGLFILVLTVLSCSSDDSGATNANGPKVSSINEKIYYDGMLESNNSFNFNYENGILTNVVMGNSIIEFDYTANKITTAKFYTNNVLESTDSFEYTGDLLTSITNDVHLEKTVYTYTGGTLHDMSSYYYSDNNNWELNQSTTFTFNNNNIRKIINEYSGSMPFKSSYDFDSANNPFRNMNPYMRLYANFESIDVISNNNITKQYSYESATSTIPALSHNYVIVYNAQNYPISVKKYADTELLSEMIITYTE